MFCYDSGYQSCIYAEIRDVFRVEAYGYRSLAEVQIFGGERVDIDGYRVLEGGIVDSDTSTDTEWRLDGTEAAFTTSVKEQLDAPLHRIFPLFVQ